MALSNGFVDVWFVPTDGSILYLYFYYLMNLNIMTVKTKVSIPMDLNSTISAGCVCARGCSSALEWKVFKSVFFSRDLLKSDTLLSCLYAGDHGGETPNPANRYQFDKVGCEQQRRLQPATQASTPHLLNLCGFIFAFSSIVCFGDHVEELGHPYMWVQNLGGLQFPVGASEVSVYLYYHPI